MSKFVDLSGEQIGLWKVLHRCDPPEGRKQNGAWFLCQCSCKAQTVRPVSSRSLSLRKKDPSLGSGSCGCMRDKVAGDLRRRHGMTGTATYHSWQAAIKRCTNPNDPAYPSYGGREDNPRTFCERWKLFDNFLADMGEAPEKTTLDRKDNSKGYWCGKPECPECGPLNREPNCRWVSKGENTRNREDVTKILYQGEMLTYQQVVEKAGVSMSGGCLKYRMETKKMTVEEALAEPARKRTLTYEYQGEQWTSEELSALCGIPARMIATRVGQYGWSVDRAISEPVNDQMGQPIQFEWEGKKWTLKELSEHSGVPTRRLHRRLVVEGRPIEEALQNKDFRKA